MNKYIGFFKQNWGLLVTLALSMVGILLPELAFAQTTGGLNTSQLALNSTDQSQILFFDTFFPSSGTSPVSGVIGAFNGAVLFVAGVIVAYTLAAGTVNTAHDGEMLGRRWSTTWLPIRIALGSAAIFPISNGFCAIQLIVIFLASEGAGLGNVVWNAFNGTSTGSTSSSSTSVNGTASFLPYNTTGDVTALAIALFKSNICVDLSNNKLNSDGDWNSSLGQPPPYSAFNSVSPSLFSNSTTTVYNFGSASGSVFFGLGTSSPGNQCGSYTVVTPTPSTTPTSTASNAPATQQSLQQNLSAAVTAVIQAQTAQLTSLQSSMQTAATAYIANPTTYNYTSAIQTAVNSYVTNINSTSQTQYSSAISSSTFQTDMTKDGWLFAGAYFMKLIQVQSYVNSAVEDVPQITSAPVLSKTPDETDINNAFAQISNQMGNPTSGVDNNGLSDAANNQGTSIGGDASGSWISRKIKSVLTDAFGGASNSSILQYMTDPKQNPIILAKNIGDWTINMGWLCLGAAGAGVIAIAGGSVGILGALANMVSNLGLAAAIALFGLGAGLSILVPMTPYVIWFGVIAAWMISVIEAVVAAPLWAVAHLDPDGDGIVGKAGQGYMMILGICLRPALAIIGLVFAMYLMSPLAYFINSTFYSVFSMMEQSTLTGPITFIGMIAIYFSLIQSCVKKSFSLMHVIPDTVLQWLGGRMNVNFGDYAGGAERDIQQGFSTGMNVAKGGISNAGGAAIQMAREAGQRKQQAQASVKDGASKMEQLGSQVTQNRAMASQSKSLANNARAAANNLRNSSPAQAAQLDLEADKLEQQAQSYQNQADSASSSLDATMQQLKEDRAKAGGRLAGKQVRDNLDKAIFKAGNIHANINKNNPDIEPEPPSTPGTQSPPSPGNTPTAE